jgi:hypothetical protein
VENGGLYFLMANLARNIFRDFLLRILHRHLPGKQRHSGDVTFIIKSMSH